MHATEKNYGPKSNCKYVIGVHVLFSILYAATLSILYIYSLYIRTKQETFKWVCAVHFIFTSQGILFMWNRFSKLSNF